MSLSQEENVVNVVVGIFVVVVFVVVKVNVRVNRIASMEEETKNVIHERVLLPHHPYTLTIPQSARTPFLSLFSFSCSLFWFSLCRVSTVLEFSEPLTMRKTWQENLDLFDIDI